VFPGVHCQNRTGKSACATKTIRRTMLVESHREAIRT
jgi:hypothetical protein